MATVAAAAAAAFHPQAARSALTMTTLTTRKLRKRDMNRVSKPMRTPSYSFKLNRLGFLLAMIRDAAEIGRQNAITNTITKTNITTTTTSSFSSSSSSVASSSPTCSTHTDAAEDYDYHYYYSRNHSYLPDGDAFPRSRHASVSSSFSCEGLSSDEMRELWMCMLELQMRYGCYNSTRMHLAVNAGEDAVHLMPNPFILDTLNNSVVHLPDEGWEMLTRHLRHPCAV